MDRQTDGQTDGRTDGQTENGKTIFPPIFRYGGMNRDPHEYSFYMHFIRCFFKRTRCGIFRQQNKFHFKKLIFVLEREENIVGKGGNAGYQHFLLFPQCFQKGFFPRVVKSRDCVVKSFNFCRIRVKMEKKATGEGNYQSIFDRVMPLSRLGIFPENLETTAERCFCFLFIQWFLLYR